MKNMMGRGKKKQQADGESLAQAEGSIVKSGKQPSELAMSVEANTKAVEKREHFGWIMAVYLIGLFVGALSTGIITPARTIIQNGLGVDDATGIWMINIFTLCYAAIIPISGKLADRHGRKIIFIISIALFGIGSLVCGFAEGLDSFAVLIAGRIIQALGAGGIMPIATAEFGTSFPEEKRGMALGLVGGVYGIANVLGATAGSGILGIFGADQWQWIFYINIPFCVLVIVGGFIFIPNHKSEVAGKIDKLGTLVMTVIILALLYGLKNIDFFDFLGTIKNLDVWPFLLLFFALIPVFVIIEKHADDPIFHMEYMTNRQIAITLAMGALVGASMMGMIFIPQFAENALKLSPGVGGYFVLVLGLCAGLGSPISGMLIDKYGSKVILALGFIISTVGCFYLAFVATSFSNLPNVIISLGIIGIGMGLTMGTPLNYMMLRNTNDEDSNSALATLSLVRSIGTAIAPAIMIGFIIQASSVLSTSLMDSMPEIPQVPEMVQKAELKTIISDLESSSDEAKEMFAEVDLDKMSNTEMSMDEMKGEGELNLPDDILMQLQTSDVTNIVEVSKNMAAWMFGSNTPGVITDIQEGIAKGIGGIGEGIDGINSGIEEMQGGVSEMESGMSGIQDGINGVSQGIDGIQQGIDEMDGKISDMEAMIAMLKTGQMPSGAGSESGMPSGAGSGSGMPSGAGSGSGMPSGASSGSDMMTLDQAQAALAGMQQGRAEMVAQQDELRGQRSQMQGALADMRSGRLEMLDAITAMQEQLALMQRAQELMTEMHDGIPGVFQSVQSEYLVRIEDNREQIENVYQSTLNSGYRNMYICTGVFNIIGLVLLLFYKDDKNMFKKEEESADDAESVEPLEAAPQPVGSAS